MRFILLLLLSAGKAVGVADCTADLSSLRAALVKRVSHTRPQLKQEIEALQGSDGFWLEALIALKSEQERFSDLYYLPKGEARLESDDQRRLMAAYSARFKPPQTREGWRRFYFNHLQSLIHFTARIWKEEKVRAMSLRLEEPALHVDAWTFPSWVDEPSVRSSQLRAIDQGITPEALLAPEIESRLPLARRQICCKSEGGCAYCPHNRRQLRD